MYLKWPALRGPQDGLTYARASVLNGCRSAHRHLTVRRRHAAALSGRPQVSPDTGSAVADRSAVAAALRVLPRRQREAVVLRYLCDLDVAEISAILRIGPSTVRSTVSRGLAALATALGEDGR